MFSRYRGVRTELQLDGVAGANHRRRGIPFHRDGTEGLHPIKQPWLNLAVLFAKILRRCSRGLPLSPVKAAPSESLQQTEPHEKQNEPLNKG